MIYRAYGSTNIQVSAIGFGGMRFDRKIDNDTHAALVCSAYEDGINYFDTAPGYGDSEKIFGIAFNAMKKTREKKPFYVSTKTFQSTPDKVRRDLEMSLSRMGLNCIDFFHVWSVMSLDDFESRKRKGVLDAVERLKGEGLIKHICVSTHMKGSDIETIVKDYPFDGVLMGYSVMNFAYREEGLEAASKHKRGVVVMNPLGGGLIPQNPERFKFVTTQENESVAEGALRFLLNDPRITLPLVGIANSEELQSALDAVQGFQPISDDKIAAIREELSSAMDALCTNCRYCDSCPEGIPIPKLMDAHSQFLLNNDHKFLIDRLKWHWGLDPMNRDNFNRCTRCGQCEELCTQKLPIPDRMEEVRIEVEKYRSQLPKKEIVRTVLKNKLKKLKSRIDKHRAN